MQALVIYGSAGQMMRASWGEDELHKWGYVSREYVLLINGSPHNASLSGNRPLK